MAGTGEELPVPPCSTLVRNGEKREGPQGRSYAIPTMQGGVETIAPYVERFIRYARRHPEQTFLVTPIGCGIAGFSPREIAPLFREAVDVENIHLPNDFWEQLA